ncbi:MAG: hypothetical protein QOH93_2741 [Chloroflexia bacterium]|jgi:transcriptional regulator with XRE-family HTH domain|nr:hypothetical protein [Chloroflexia bacterium]
MTQSAEEIKAALARRNGEIADLLYKARTDRNIPIVACAAAIGTTRQRYAAIEQKRAKAYITAVELERIMAFLQIPTGRILRGTENVESHTVREVQVRIQPSETVCVVIDVAQDS